MSDGRRRWGPRIALVAAVALLAVVGTLWALRGTIATSIARGELDARGVRCDDRFAVSLDATFGEATIGPTRCEHEGGLVEAVELLGDVTVTLEGLAPSRIRGDSVRVVLREADVRGGSSWASELRQLGLEQRVAGLVKGLSELGAMDLPATEVATAEVVRGGDRIAAARGLTLGGGRPAPVAAEQIAFTAGPGGVGRLTLREVTGEASASRVHLAGRAEASAGIAILQISRAGAFTLDAEGLETSSPSFRLSADL